MCVCVCVCVCEREKDRDRPALTQHSSLYSKVLTNAYGFSELV